MPVTKHCHETEFKPLLLDIPQAIETSRLLIRMPQVGDGEVVNDATLESLSELRRWVSWVHPVPTRDDAEEFVRRAIGNWHLRTQITMLIFQKSSQKFIGATGFYAIDWNAKHFETGYWCRTSMTGQGFITETMEAMTSFAFKKLSASRLEIRCDAENIRSRKIPERLGFNIEGQLSNVKKRFDDASMGTLLIFARTANHKND